MLQLMKLTVIGRIPDPDTQTPAISIPEYHSTVCRAVCRVLGGTSAARLRRTVGKRGWGDNRATEGKNVG